MDEELAMMPIDEDCKKENDEEKDHDDDNPKNKTNELLYKLDDKPAWHMCFLLGIQHCILSIGGMIGYPFLIRPFLCMPETDEGYLGLALLLSSLFFVSGIISFLQTTFGTRLPIMQGASFSFLPPTLAILALPHNKCPLGPIDQNQNLTPNNTLYNDTDGSIVDGTEMWQRRMREVQGAIIVASLLEFCLAVTGAVGFLMKFVGPLTVVPSITLIGLALFEVAAADAAGHWGIAALTSVVLITSSQYLSNVEFPVPTYSRREGCHVMKTNLFKLFPVLITIIFSCTICTILTFCGAFPDKPSEVGYQARVDVRISVLSESPWFRIPYPLQWGPIKITGAGVIGMIAGVLAGMIESIGDYYACAKMSGGPPLPKHALNRGLAMEGFGCVFAGLIGYGTGTTSFSENIAAIGITRVGSRRVLQVAGIVFAVFGVLGKLGAIMILIPGPVVGGLYCTMFGMIAAVGLSNLQYVNLNSTRNLFILGYSIFMGLAIPVWMKDNPGAIHTGAIALDQILTVLLQTPMFIGGFLGAFLDNTIPGTLKDRGMLTWNAFESNVSDEESEQNSNRMASCYNLPFSTDFRFAKYIPILPEYGRKDRTLIREDGSEGIGCNME